MSDPALLARSGIAVVDYRAADASARLVDSLRRTGFAVLTDHPIPRDLVDGIYREWLAFFDGPAKHKYAWDPARHDGYYAPGQAETAKGYSLRDLKEYFHIYPWGRYPAEVTDAARRYYALASALAAELLGWIERETPPEVSARFSMPLSRMIEGSPLTLLRVLRYPPLGDAEAGTGAQRAAAHEDINLLTLLPAATESGLEVRDRQGIWHQAPADFGALIVNAGDMLQEASGGFYPSTSHRVVNPSGEARRRSRISLPLFLHPRDEVVLSARHTAKSYLAERRAANYGARA